MATIAPPLRHSSYGPHPASSVLLPACINRWFLCQEQIRQMLADALMGVIAQNLLKKKPKGRVAALEILIVNTAVANLIREGKTFQIPSSMQVGAREGMVLLNDALLKLVAEGVVEPGEAMSKTMDKKDFEQKLRVAFGGQSS